MKIKDSAKIATIILCLCIFITSNLHVTLEKIMPTLTNLLITLESITALAIITISLLGKKKETQEQLTERRPRPEQENRAAIHHLVQEEIKERVTEEEPEEKTRVSLRERNRRTWQ